MAKLELSWYLEEGQHPCELNSGEKHDNEVHELALRINFLPWESMVPQRGIDRMTGKA